MPLSLRVLHRADVARELQWRVSVLLLRKGERQVVRKVSVRKEQQSARQPNELPTGSVKVYATIPRTIVARRPPPRSAMAFASGEESTEHVEFFSQRESQLLCCIRYISLKEKTNDNFARHRQDSRG